MTKPRPQILAMLADFGKIQVSSSRMAQPNSASMIAGTQDEMIVER